MPRTTTSQPQEEMTLETAMSMLKDLQARMEEAEKALLEKDETIKAAQGEIKDLKAQEDGWLLITKNPLYDGDTAGLQFHSGMAFVPKNKEFPGFKHPKPKQEIWDRMKPEDKLKIEGLMAIPTSKRFVDYLVADFGYEAIYLAGDDLEKIKEYNASRAKERAEALKKIESAESMSKLVSPHRF